MVDQHALLQAYEDFAEALLHPYDIGELLYRLTDQVVAVLEIDGAGVSLARDGQGLAFVTASDRRVAGIEDVQVSEADGPCQDAYHHGRQVQVADLREECPWPDYATESLSRGMRSVAGLPMPLGSRRIGAMDLYRAEPGPWSDADLRVGQLLANLAAGYILNNMALSQSRTLATQLQEALDSRVIIEQAKGMLSAQRAVSPDHAFALLRDHARRTSTRLHDVCRGLVSGTLEIDEEAS